jgi:hypothetical protein
MVYFKLKDDSTKARKKLVVACQKYLSNHEGAVYFSAGVLAEDLDREVNDRDFDVSLGVVFRNKAAHDRYQTHPRHQKFIEENKESWAAVRVFDSYLAAPLPDEPLAQRIPLPDPASFFAGMISGKVIQKRKRQVVVAVSEVTNEWKHSRAEKSAAMNGKNVLVDAGDNDMIQRFLTQLEVGEEVTLDVAHKDGETLTVLELAEDQREQVRED